MYLLLSFENVKSLISTIYCESLMSYSVDLLKACRRNTRMNDRYSTVGMGTSAWRWAESALSPGG